MLHGGGGTLCMAVDRVANPTTIMLANTVGNMMPIIEAAVHVELLFNILEAKPMTRPDDIRPDLICPLFTDNEHILNNLSFVFQRYRDN